MEDNRFDYRRVDVREDDNSETQEEEEDKDKKQCCGFFRRTKMKVMIVGTAWIFINGLDRSIILPTLWLYLQNRFNTEVANQYYGATLALPNTLSLLASPLYAYIAHKKIARVKTIIVATNCLPTLGNLFYFAGPHPWLILIGRGIGGIGQCLGLVLLAELARCTTTKERTAYAAIWLMTHQVGYVLGPGLNLIMHHIRFRCLGFLVDVYNTPGFLIAILRSLSTLLAVLLYPNLSYDHVKPDGTCMELKDVRHGDKDAFRIDPKKRKSISWFEIAKELIKLESISLITIIFVGYFCLMALESAVPLIFHRYFGWDEKFTSIVFLCMAGLLILCYLIVCAISSLIEDRNLLLSGLLILSSTYLWLMVTLVFINVGQRPLYIGLTLVAVFSFTIGQPLAFSAVDSLLTKCIPLPVMEFAQAVRNCVIVLGFTLSTLLSGYINGWIMFAIMLTLTLTAVTLTGVIYRRVVY